MRTVIFLIGVLFYMTLLSHWDLIVVGGKENFVSTVNTLFIIFLIMDFAEIISKFYKRN